MRRCLWGKHMKNLVKAGSALIVCMAAASQASAHVSFLNASAAPEATTVATLQVPHGCDGKATTEVQVKLPEGFISAQPQPKAGWELEVIKGDYQKTYSNHGSDVKSGALEIRWKGGNLPDEYYDTFVIRGKVSGVEAGASLPFAVTQLCGTEASVAWTEVAAEGVDPHSLKNPAPLLKIAAKDGEAAAGHGGHGGGHGDHAAADAAKLGDLALSGGFVKAMLPGQKVAGGFITIDNAGHDADRLVSAASPAAGRVEIHEMAMQGDVMKMRQLEGGVAVPAGEKVELKPGGLHFMFMDVKEAYKEGGTVPVTLKFEKAGEVTLELPVKAVTGSGGGHDHK